MPRLPGSSIPPSVGTSAAWRRRAGWPRCRACGMALHPYLASAEDRGTHPMCDPRPARHLEVVRGE